MKISEQRACVARDILCSELEKLAKTDLRAVLVTRQQIVGWLAHCLGLEDEEILAVLSWKHKYGMRPSEQVIELGRLTWPESHKGRTP